VPGRTGDGLGRRLLMGAGKERRREEEGKKTERKKENLSVGFLATLPAGVRRRLPAFALPFTCSVQGACCTSIPTSAGKKVRV